MKIGELIELLKQMPSEYEVYFDIHGGGMQDLRIEPVTESCDDPTIVGYVLTDEPTNKQMRH